MKTHFGTMMDGRFVVACNHTVNEDNHMTTNPETVDCDYCLFLLRDETLIWIQELLMHSTIGKAALRYGRTVSPPRGEKKAEAPKKKAPKKAAKKKTKKGSPERKKQLGKNFRIKLNEEKVKKDDSSK